MDRSFHVFVCEHATGVSVELLGEPHLSAFAPTRDEARRDLAIVVGRLLRRGELVNPHTALVEPRLQRVALVVRALQRDRLIEVPLRFTLVTSRRRGDPDAPVTVMVPRLALEATLREPDDVLPYAEEIIRHELHLAPLARLLEAASGGDETLETLIVEAPTAAATARKKASPPAPTKPTLPAVLRETCQLLEEDRARGVLGRAFERDQELRRLEALLSPGQRGSMLLIGPTAAGKTALVHELVHRIAEPSHPLASLEIFSTSGGRILAGMRYLGEWEERLGKMLAELKKRAAVLYLPSLSELLASSSDVDDIARFLLPTVESGEIALLVEATPEEAARAWRTHGAFLQALQPFTVGPLGGAAVQRAVTASTNAWARQRHLRFETAAIDRALDLGERFGRGMPGAALEILQLTAQGRPTATSTSASPAPVSARQVTEAFCRQSGYPPALVDPQARFDFASVLADLRSRVVGQDGAMELLAQLVLSLKTNLTDPSKPLGSFLLLGPTGVGKTESALALTAYLFGDEKRLVRFDMAEYAAPGSAVRLLAAGGGSLAKQIRERPFGVVLFDEIEKADASVLDLLLQVLGEGRISDNQGQTVSFRNTVVLLTSNLGAETAGRSLGFGGSSLAAHESHYRAAAAAHFRPELLNRFDQIVPYHPLTPAALRILVQRLLQQALAREGLVNRGVKVSVPDAVIERLAVLGHDPRYGARPLKRAIEEHVVTSLARALSQDASAKSFALGVDDLGAISAHVV